MGKGRLKIAVLGSTRGTDMQAIIDAIEAKSLDAEIVLAASDKKDAFILERARKHGIETLYVDYEKHGGREGAEREFVEKFLEKKAGIVLLIGFMKILSPYFVRQFRGRAWNIHPSLLPKYAGGRNMDVHAQVLAGRERESGCTLHEVGEQVDKGRVIMQKKCPVSAGETPETLREKVQKLEQECLLEALKRVIEGKIIIGERIED